MAYDQYPKKSYKDCGQLSLVIILVITSVIFLLNLDSINEVCSDNIGETCHQGSRHLPIDVVYTWVNGSDSLLLKNIQLYKKLLNDPHYSIDNSESKSSRTFTGRSLLKVLRDEKTSFDSNENDLDNPFEIQRDCPIDGCIKAPIVVSSSYVTDEKVTIDYVKSFIGFTNAIELKHTTPENSESSLIFVKFPSISDAEVATGKVLTHESQTLKFKLVFYSLQHGDGPYVSTSSKIVDISSCNQTEIKSITSFLSHDVSQNLMCIEKNILMNLELNCLKTFPENFLVWPPWEKYKIGKLSFSDVGAHRFADNQELRYSLRSLYMHAPWVRNIYILTNGQIPSWLNINHKRIKVISHFEVFQNKSHLPTFSSPAIEANMHNIPGLSENFLYLNDDVFFGRTVYPEDFISTEGYKIYLAWNIPNCNAGCPPNWVKDGYCDLSCNVSSCNFDGGDCEAGSAGNIFNNMINNGPEMPASHALNYCHTGCALSWVGDKYCDPACNVYDCGFDAGDCGTADISSKVFEIDLVNADNNTEVNIHGFPAMYINVTLHNDTVSAASYESLSGNSTIIRTSVLSLVHKILSLTFFPNRTNTVTFQLLLSSEKQRFISLHIDSNSVNSKSYIKPTKESYRNKSDSTDENWTIPEIESITFRDEYENEINEMLNSFDYRLHSEDSQKRSEQLQKLVNDGVLTEKGKWVKLGQFVKMTHRRSQSVAKRKLHHAESLPQRQLFDTFADSLHHVDNLYTSYFGKEQRKVISHMPFLVNKFIVKDLHSRFPAEFNKTSSNRFRSSDDMQFAFSYFYFIIHAKHKQNVTEFLHSIDTNGDGDYNNGELNILLTHLFDLPITKHNRTKFWDLVESCSQELNTEKMGPHNIVQCSNFSSIISCTMQNVSTYPHEILDDKDVTFKMLKSNSSKVRIDLDYVRRNPKKFICLNDNMDHGNSLEHFDNVHQLTEFYQAMFPYPSPFEHLPGEENRFLHKSNHSDTLFIFNDYSYIYVIFYVFVSIMILHSCYLKRRTLSRIFKHCILRFFTHSTM